eukprot:364287-Chlamydomonas_euryale.AAC.12
MRDAAKRRVYRGGGAGGTLFKAWMGLAGTPSANVHVSIRHGQDLERAEDRVHSAHAALTD